MGERYSHLSLTERRRIEEMFQASIPVQEIAARLGRHRGTIHREINRNFYHTSFRDRYGNDYRGYYCMTANALAKRRRRSGRVKLLHHPALLALVVANLHAGWSPQLVSGRLKIDPRPVGQMERQTRYLLLLSNEDRRSAGVMSRITNALGPLHASARRSIIFDRGTEFVGAWRSLRMPSWFCNPHSPWQKGALRMSNSPVEDRSSTGLSAIAARMTETPRKCLRWQTPTEAFSSKLAAIKRTGYDELQPSRRSTSICRAFWTFRPSAPR